MLEIGWGNSCFADDFIKSQNSIASYSVIDNNEYAISLFKNKPLQIQSEAICIDVSEEIIAPKKQYDFVYSIGLIEHFDKEMQRRVIENHFKFYKAGGAVMISFPTPTLKYRFFRRLMELVGKWQFYDERPLWINDIIPILEKNGEIIRMTINRKLFLTQSIVLVRKGEIDA